jgi:hypothetical protein
MGKDIMLDKECQCFYSDSQGIFIVHGSCPVHGRKKSKMGKVYMFDESKKIKVEKNAEFYLGCKPQSATVHQAKFEIGEENGVWFTRWYCPLCPKYEFKSYDDGRMIFKRQEGIEHFGCCGPKGFFE